MRRILTTATLLAPLLIANQGKAAAISYSLNEVINGGSSLSPTQSFGTVTYFDNPFDANKVDFAISLNGASWKVQEFFFNYNDNKFANDTAFTLSGDVGSYSITENGTKANGYTAGMFDVQAPKSGNIGTQPIQFTIALKDSHNNEVNLDPSDFDFKDTSGKLFNVIHIANCGASACTPNSGTGNASIWVGSGDPMTAQVSEPAALASVGIGLVGLGLVRRGRRGQA